MCDTDTWINCSMQDPNTIKGTKRSQVLWVSSDDETIKESYSQSEHKNSLKKKIHNQTLEFSNMIVTILCSQLQAISQDSFWKSIQLCPVQRYCSHCLQKPKHTKKDRRRPRCRDRNHAKYEQAQQQWHTRQFNVWTMSTNMQTQMPKKTLKRRHPKPHGRDRLWQIPFWPSLFDQFGPIQFWPIHFWPIFEVSVVECCCVLLYCCCVLLCWFGPSPPHAGPALRIPFRRTTQNFALLFFLSRPHVALFSLGRSSRWSVAASPGFHKTARELQTCTFQAPALQTPPNSTRRHPERDKKERKWGERGQKKREILDLPTLRPPTLRAPNPSGPSTLRAPPPFGLEETDFGQSRFGHPDLTNPFLANPLDLDVCVPWRGPARKRISTSMKYIRVSANWTLTSSSLSESKRMNELKDLRKSSAHLLSSAFQENPLQGRAQLAVNHDIRQTSDFRITRLTFWSCALAPKPHSPPSPHRVCPARERLTLRSRSDFFLRRLEARSLSSDVHVFHTFVKSMDSCRS